MALLGEKAWGSRAQEWGPATEGGVVAPNLCGMQSSHPEGRATLAHCMRVARTPLTGRCPVADALGCPLPSWPESVATASPPGLPPPHVLWSSCFPCLLPSPPPVSSWGQDGRERHRDGIRSPAGHCGVGCVQGGGPGTADTLIRQGHTPPALAVASRLTPCRE